MKVCEHCWTLRDIDLNAGNYVKYARLYIYIYILYIYFLFNAPLSSWFL